MSEIIAQRIIEESVPGKQVTLAHVIAAPIEVVYESLGVENNGAIGILTISPYEAAIIAADIAGKSADVTVGFLDRFTGSVLLNGDVQSVEVALESVVSGLKNLLGFEVVSVTRS
ncbi:MULTISPECIES: BMC domain-containing protein [unclassified Enterococcus]|uniref:BMC domain-containing protein n=1 Tax=unclassified Enterococcus TaxID=2608891 RepID=UPI001A9121B3|nr:MULTISPECIES: BMC domain-containing protein [unclassified Enterococcus]MBO0462650.1 BMC domain-containing protein [Enterococcus sp. DIV1298c]MBO1300601.1 BMC domain-containing protein [Enterococcus sp. DIV1271a]